MSDLQKNHNGKVSDFEDAVLESGVEELRIPITHFLHGGMYSRTAMIPKGTMLTGCLTNCDNLCVVSGDIEFSVGGEKKRIVGYGVIPARKGVKRAGLTHANTWWTTVFRTDAKTVDEAEREFTDEMEMLQSERLTTAQIMGDTQ